MDETGVSWEHTTHSFGEPYGAQRGGVEVSICGPGDARVRVACGGRSFRVGLAELAERLAGGPWAPERGAEPGLPGELILQPATGALLGLGVRELDVAFDDAGPPRPGVLLRPGVPGGRRAGLVVTDLGAVARPSPATGDRAAGTGRRRRRWSLRRSAGLSPSVDSANRATSRRARPRCGPGRPGRPCRSGRTPGGSRGRTAGWRPRPSAARPPADIGSDAPVNSPPAGMPASMNGP